MEHVEALDLIEPLRTNLIVICSQDEAIKSIVLSTKNDPYADTVNEIHILSNRMLTNINDNVSDIVRKESDRLHYLYYEFVNGTNRIIGLSQLIYGKHFGPVGAQLSCHAKKMIQLVSELDGMIRGFFQFFFIQDNTYARSTCGLIRLDEFTESMIRWFTSPEVTFVWTQFTSELVVFSNRTALYRIIGGLLTAIRRDRTPRRVEISTESAASGVALIIMDPSDAIVEDQFTIRLAKGLIEQLAGNFELAGGRDGTTVRIMFPSEPPRETSEIKEGEG